MKIIPIILLLTFLYSCSSTKNINNDSKPNFKTISEALYSPKRSGEISREEALKSKISKVSFYNSKGFLMEYQQYESDGTIYSKAELEKNKKGELLKGTRFDGNGNLKEFWTTKFDANGNVIEFKTYNSDNELLSIQSNKYDSNGNEIEFSLKSLKNDYTNWTKLKYNSSNQLIERKKHNGIKNKTDTRTYKYDVNGNKIEEKLVRDNGSILVFRNEFDINKNLTNQKWFDKNGKQTHTTSFEYVYDKYGNWITKKRSSKGVLGMIWERNITYH